MPQAHAADLVVLAAARERVLERIGRAAERAGRDPGDVTLVAVSKTVPAERLRAAVAVGLTILGENRVQEATAKIPAVAGATWHLVGPLQSNKAKRAVELFDVVQSLDSLELAERLARLAGDLRPGRPLPVLVQVNVDRDPGKFGIAPDAAAAVAASIAALPNIDVRGLMTIGRLADTPAEARATFRGLRELSASVRRGARIGAELSMGMSDDFEIAVEEGATIVRIGRAIFGERPAG